MALMVAAKFDQPDCLLKLVVSGADLSLVISVNSQVDLLRGQSKHYLLSHLSRYEEILLEYVLWQTLIEHAQLQALYFAARAGNLITSFQPLKFGYVINALNENEFSHLIIAARGRNADFADCCCRTLLRELIQPSLV